MTEESILLSVKKNLGGIALGNDHFDEDLITNINSALMILRQIGVGPVSGFSIEGPEETWEDYLGSDLAKLQSVKEYIVLRVKLAFDPPSSSFVLESLRKERDELEWRLNVEVDPGE